MSHDGHAWQSIRSDIDWYDLVSDGRHAIQVALTESADGTTPTGIDFSEVTDDGHLATLTQTGVGPLGPSADDVNLWMIKYAVGPTGIVATDGRAFWILLPTA